MERHEPAIESLLEQSGWLQRLARSLVRDAHHAEDAVQETLVTALERPGEARSSLRGWLGTILRNRVRQEERARVRREDRERRARHTSPAPATGQVSERLELQALLLEAVRSLEEPYRSAVVRRFFDGLAPRAIAKREGVPVKTVNTRLDRGLAKLRARLDGKFGGDRSAWLQGLLPFAGSAGPSAWPALVEGVAMSTKVKIASLLVVVAGAVWFGSELLVSDARGTAEERVELASAPISTGLPEHSGQLVEPGAPEPGPGARASVPARETRPERATFEVSSSAPTAPLPSGQATLTVRVVKEKTLAPIAEARVEVRVLSGTTEAAGRAVSAAGASTGADGSARIDVPAGQRLWVTVESGSWDPQDPVRRGTVETEPLVSGEERSLTIELAHGLDRIFHGQVLAAEDGRALPDALVVPDPLRDGSPTASADASGYFEFPYPSWEPGEVEVRCEGYGPRRLRLGFLDQTRAEPYVVVLERAAAIEAHVVAVGPASLEFKVVAEQGTSRTVKLDAAGRAVVEGLPAHAELRLELHSSGELVWRETEPWVLSPGERAVLELNLGGGTFVYGTLRDQEGAPVVDQVVWAIAAEGDESVEGRSRWFEPDLRERAQVARPNAHGRYEYLELPPGRWWIGPEAGGEGSALAARAVGIELQPGEPSRRLDLVSHRGLWIRGRVLGPEAGAFENAFVMAGGGCDQGRIQTFSGDGAFALGPLVPGTYSLRAFSDGVFGWGEPVRVAAGTEGVEIRIGEMHSIAGRVVDADGNPADAHVHLLQRSGSLGQGTSSREQGAFLFIDLEPGTYTVQAEAPDGRVTVQQVVLERRKRITGLVLTLEEGARIGVRHAFDHGVRCSIWSGAVLVADSTVRSGEENFETVPAGPIRVELYDGTGTLAERELEARAGRVETVAFDP